jgi:predicted extracellular nuclease
MRIGSVQGGSDRSPFVGRQVRVEGIVTRLRADGYFLQDDGDGDPATSDALFVRRDAPAVRAGDKVEVEGVVMEFTPPGHGRDYHPVTELHPTAADAIVARGRPLPAPVGLGKVPGELAAATAAYERLEAMRVSLPTARVIGSTRGGNDLVVLPSGAGARTHPRGPVIRTAGHNPERLPVSAPDPAPAVDVGASVAGIVGVLDYAHGAYRVHADAPVDVRRSPNVPQVTSLVGSATALTVVSYNVENLDPGDGERFALLARHIADNLRAPDVVALQEVQDGDGPLDSTVVNAAETLARLTAAILAAGGPRYAPVDLPPLDDADGGEPGGNIRVAYLYRPDRVALEWLKRIGDGDPCFAHCRKPLVAMFQFRGQRVPMINVHLTSPAGSPPLFGPKPFAPRGDDKRAMQAEAVGTALDALHAALPTAHTVVLGDFNTTPDAAALATLRARMTNLIDLTPSANRYTLVHAGEGSVFDHIYARTAQGAACEIVHVNADFHDGVSDHDPVIARIELP